MYIRNHKLRYCNPVEGEREKERERARERERESDRAREGGGKSERQRGERVSQRASECCWPQGAAFWFPGLPRG